MPVNQVVFEDGEKWYYNTYGGRQRYHTVTHRNNNRMYVNGTYIPRSHPFHKAGRFTLTEEDLNDFLSLALATPEEEPDKSGEVYVITNDLFRGWVKVGMAKNLQGRFNNYSTYTPFDGEGAFILKFNAAVSDRFSVETDLHHILEHQFPRNREWFKAEPEQVVGVIQEYLRRQNDAEDRNC